MAQRIYLWHRGSTSAPNYAVESHNNGCSRELFFCLWTQDAMWILSSVVFCSTCSLVYPLRPPALCAAFLAQLRFSQMKKCFLASCLLEKLLQFFGNNRQLGLLGFYSLRLSDKSVGRSFGEHCAHNFHICWLMVRLAESWDSQHSHELCRKLVRCVVGKLQGLKAGPVRRCTSVFSRKNLESQ